MKGFRHTTPLVSILMLAIFVTAAVMQVRQSQQQQQQLMASQVNMLSSLLASTLTPLIEQGDNDTLETMVPSLLAKSPLTEVAISDAISSESHVWQQGSPAVEGAQSIPEWFTTLVPLDETKKHTVLKSGWVELATITLTADPAPYYSTLWKTTKSSLALLFFPVFGIWTLFIWRQNKDKAALLTITRQITNYSSASFPMPSRAANNSELHLLTTAINGMSAKFQKMVESMNTELETLRNNMMVDSVSGLPNRQYLTHQLNSWFDENETGNGAVILVQMDWLNTLHQKLGYQVRDETWRLLAHSLQSLHGHTNDSCIARVSNIELAILLPEYNHESTRQYLQNLIRAINSEVTLTGLPANVEFSIGVAICSGSTGSELLAKADRALQEAILTHQVYTFAEDSVTDTRTREEWRKLLASSLDDNALKLHWQPVINIASGGADPFHREVYTQLSIEDNWQPAGPLMSYLSLFSLGSQFDRRVIETLTLHHVVRPLVQPVAINITNDSILDPTFLDWLESYLGQNLPANKLCFELTEASVQSNLETCIQFAHRVHQMGATIGVDHFGRYLKNVGYLQQLKPEYVKLDRAFSQDSGGDNRVFLDMLINMASSLNILVVATGIQDRDKLADFGDRDIAAYQGFINPPVPIATEALTP